MLLLVRLVRTTRQMLMPCDTVHLQVRVCQLPIFKYLVSTSGLEKTSKQRLFSSSHFIFMSKYGNMGVPITLIFFDTIVLDDSPSFHISMVNWMSSLLVISFTMDWKKSSQD